MKRNPGHHICLFLILSFFSVSGFVCAGDLDPSAPPTAGTMHTLDEIYDAVTAGCPACDQAPLAKTGQTTSYVVGDDGTYQAGVPDPSPRFTDNGDGTFTDHLTNLTWLTDLDAFFSQATGWEACVQYATTISDGFANGGFTLSDGSTPGDWRMPNLKELMSLYDYGSTELDHLPDGIPATFSNSDMTVWTSTSPALVTHSFKYNWPLGSIERELKTSSSPGLIPVKGGL